MLMRAFRISRRRQRKRHVKEIECYPWARLMMRYVHRMLALRPYEIYPARLPEDRQLGDRQRTLLNAALRGLGQQIWRHADYMPKIRRRARDFSVVIMLLLGACTCTLPQPPMRTDLLNDSTSRDDTVEAAILAELKWQARMREIEARRKWRDRNLKDDDD
jgi:hypothetical protein